ncbi:hypothetical protein IU459_27155 [Nocardia amamiensis]|uniref:Cytochrome c domain-containing protein n=1 Tax=Nocardia amamiensis TaxID=404578 RepID=A0ABS0CX73_9NOCA|nr:hypothetical protein [Nocardia amamiensis]MBF6301195.1 hypothetical protein [Nocardia amamiensis]
MIREHTHSGAPVDVDPFGRDVDAGLLGQLVGAALDGCQPCQRELIAAVADHAPTSARVVELACIGLQDALGGVPPSAYIDDDSSSFVPQFRALARTGLDGANDAMWTAAAAMTPAERAAAIDCALDTLIGLL